MNALVRCETGHTHSIPFTSSVRSIDRPNRRPRTVTRIDRKLASIACPECGAGWLSIRYPLMDCCESRRSGHICDCAMGR